MHIGWAPHPGPRAGSEGGSDDEEDGEEQEESSEEDEDDLTEAEKRARALDKFK